MLGRCDVGIIEGPELVNNATIESIERELAARNPGLWLSAAGMVLVYFEDLFAVRITIPDVDPFEPRRLSRIFDIAEQVIVAHIPRDIPLRDDMETWSVNVVTEGDNALIDGISGGRGNPSRHERLSDGVGAGARTPSNAARTVRMDFEDPLWDYLADRPALEALIADGETPTVRLEILMAAVCTGDVELVRLLFHAGGAALIDAFDDDLGWTPLMQAARKGDAAMTSFLIDAGADVNAHDESKIGDTALLLAVQHGLLDIARILVAHGADPTIPGWMGRTPLDHARDRKRMPELYELLRTRRV